MILTSELQNQTFNENPDGQIKISGESINVRTKTFGGLLDTQIFRKRKVSTNKIRHRREAQVSRGYPFKKINQGMMKCWIRNEYDTCSQKHKKLFNLKDDIIVQTMKLVLFGEHSADDCIDYYEIKTKDGCNFSFSHNRVVKMIDLSLYSIICTLKGHINQHTYIYRSGTDYYFDDYEGREVGYPRSDDDSPYMHGTIMIAEYLMRFKDFQYILMWLHSIFGDVSKYIIEIYAVDALKKILNDHPQIKSSFSW